MGNLFYDYGKRRPPLWVSFFFVCGKIARIAGWGIVQLWKTATWLPRVVAELLEGDLGPDLSRLFVGALLLTIISELWVAGLLIFALAHQLEDWVAISAGIVIYLLIGTVARCAARPYGALA